MLNEPTVTILGPDPAHRTHAINGYAFQQDALTSFNGWQYAVFYSSTGPETPEPLFIHLSRRCLPDGPWESIVFEDYPQKTDDGHNTVQIGICHEDGTIHLSYDHHCDVLRYRHSVRGLAQNPTAYEWNASLFMPTLDYLPGLPSSHKHFSYVTYPRLGNLGPGVLFMSLRDGKAGLGSDHLYLYRSDKGFWEFVGTPLTGVDSNPYVHGWDFRDGKLHVTWVYRGFVWYEGWDDLADTKHKQQAGPNGAENNHNICYAYSEDLGYTWRNGKGDVIADLKQGQTIKNDAEGIVAFEIPKGSGLMNQESQVVDYDGGVHVLNREILEGTHIWKHYYRSPTGQWTSRAIRPIDGPRRGRLGITRDNDLLLILPETTIPTVTILRALKSDSYGSYQKVWVGKGLTGEPLIDNPRLATDKVLSLFIRKDAGGPDGKRDVVVLDFEV
ncbi:hypothetical protein M406DRAFT_340231 [Cryphonectria parasitica EP155]|uniref:Uncharacterized protein n=1 Tax=Cryphonectria parasitica (strain ATCC 38755 / EP155) TaxID=660469 RepID=A0A9P5CP70_CRYP1|nr:uncharacterized protein M406DRAFT_340231 [Cryphonectria parasitica EP155]KAF3764675.1 hypothetical protein M406DRAFT_340231 [Cryphonectria parasitica EP155]